MEPAKSPEPKHSPFREVFDEILLAGQIVLGHLLLVLFMVGSVWVTNWALEKTHHEPSPTVYGVTARFLIEGGEVILVGVMLGAGIISAFLTLSLGILRRLWRRP